MLTYNRETLVLRAIASVLTQTFCDFEFIVVDNGSTDRSGALADDSAVCDSRIRVVHRERGNIGSGRNSGLDLAGGEWIAFVDDDDYCEPDFLEFLLSLVTDDGADVAICGAADKALDEKQVYSAEDAVIELLWRKKFNVQFPTKLIRRKLFDGVRFSETSKYDDIELMPRIIASANKIAYHGLAKYTFARHESNNSAWTTNHSLLDAATLNEYLSVYRERTEWLSGRFPGKSAVWRYFEWSFMISMVEKITRLGIAGCDAVLAAMRNELATNRNEFLNCELTQDFEKKWMGEYANH
jgi:glycosyltransferase involved in cell wall biosynthesis